MSTCPRSTPSTTLGIRYADQGRLRDAEMMYKRAMAGYKKALGPEHPSTLNTVTNLGNLYRHRGRLDPPLQKLLLMYRRTKT